MESYCRNCEHWEATLGGIGLCLELSEFLRTENSILARKIDDVRTSQFGSCSRFAPNRDCLDELAFERDRAQRLCLAESLRSDLAAPAAWAPPALRPTGTDTY
jgi:hypothetical protein